MSLVHSLPAEVHPCAVRGQACQPARPEAGGGGANAGRKGLLACPEAGSVQLSVSLTATLSLPPRPSRRAATQASRGPQWVEGQRHPVTVQGEGDGMRGRAGVLEGWPLFYLPHRVLLSFSLPPSLPSRAARDL